MEAYSAPESHLIGMAEDSGGVLVPFLTRIGGHHALRAGLTREDVEDCAITFVERMFLRNETLLRARLSDGSVQWLHVCARNHARSFRRASDRHRRYIATDVELCTGMESTGGVSPGQGDPTAGMIRSERWESVAACIDQLSPALQELLIRHYFLDESCQDLAARTGRTPHAVEQALLRARKRIKALLLRRGLTAADF